MIKNRDTCSPGLRTLAMWLLVLLGLWVWA